MKTTVGLFTLILCSVITLHAQNRTEFNISRVEQPPTIDAILTDDVWQREPLPMTDWVSYNPLRGTHTDTRTDIRMAYDDRYVYFAFHCFDNEPDKIRTTISRRDSVFNDDWIAISLDSVGAGQSAYHLFANPSGIQMDALNTSASGEQFEADLLWDSAGRIVEDGYIVELRVPLQSIRFSGGPEVRMGMVFFRKISRSGMSYSWPEMRPGQWVFDEPAQAVFTDLTQPRLFEALPSVTYGINQTRATPDRWNAATDNADVGVSLKYGLTSNITLDATINPDFSQVESDSFQIQTNQRFPVFFSEKRPFFMEGMGLFNVAGSGGDANMRTAVHTRRIIDPLWGLKITGSTGKVTFGLLNSSDESADDRKLFTIGRAMGSLGRSGYFGVIVTDTEQAGRHNRVAGGDILIKPSAAQQLSFTFLGSHTSGSGGSATHGTASQLSYSYNSRRYTWSNQLEHYARDFRMDTAFYNRTGYDSGWTYGALNLYPKEGSDFWVRRVQVFVFGRRARDQVQNGSEDYLNTGIRFNFTRQGFFNINHGRGNEPWRGVRYKTGGGVNINGNVQILRWLNVNGGFNKGKQIYFDPVNHFQGNSFSRWFGFTLQPNQHFSQNVNANTNSFKRASTGEKVFSVYVVNTRTTYQFNKHFLVRLLEQFDSSRRRLLTDLLASYEFAPGTVLHAGYGSLFERQPADPGYQTVSRGLFFKASYRKQF